MLHSSVMGTMPILLIIWFNSAQIPEALELLTFVISERMWIIWSIFAQILDTLPVDWILSRRKLGTQIPERQIKFCQILQATIQMVVGHIIGKKIIFLKGPIENNLCPNYHGPLLILAPTLIPADLISSEEPGT